MYSKFSGYATSITITKKKDSSVESAILVGEDASERPVSVPFHDERTLREGGYYEIYYKKKKPFFLNNPAAGSLVFLGRQPIFLKLLIAVIVLVGSVVITITVSWLVSLCFIGVMFGVLYFVIQNEQKRWVKKAESVIRQLEG